MPESGSPPAVRYRVVERLRSEAGAVDVFKAIQAGLERPVELRLLDTTKLGEQKQLLRFEREFRTLATLDHPRLLKVLDWGRMEDKVFYVTDWREMQTLEALLDAGLVLQSPQLFSLAAQLGDALVYLHSKGVVHRSLGADSVLYSPERGRCVIAQFPMVKDSRLTDLTQQGVAHFVAEAATPECVREEPATESTDLYLLGALLYRCVARRDPVRPADLLCLPSTDARSFEALILPLGDTAASQSGAACRLPAALEALVMRCLAFEPAGRPATAKAFLEELAAAEAAVRSETVHRKHQTRRASDSRATPAAARQPAAAPAAGQPGPEGRSSVWSALFCYFRSALSHAKIPASTPPTSNLEPQASERAKPALWVAGAVLVALAVWLLLR